MEHLRQLMIVLQQEKLYINLKKPPGDPFFVLEILHFSWRSQRLIRERLVPLWNGQYLPPLVRFVVSIVLPHSTVASFATSAPQHLSQSVWKIVISLGLWLRRRVSSWVRIEQQPFFSWSIVMFGVRTDIRFLTSVPIKWEMGNIGKMGLGIRFRSGHEATDYICGRETEVRGCLLYTSPSPRDTR